MNVECFDLGGSEGMDFVSLSCSVVNGNVENNSAYLGHELHSPSEVVISELDGLLYLVSILDLGGAAMV